MHVCELYFHLDDIVGSRRRSKDVLPLPRSPADILLYRLIQHTSLSSDQSIDPSQISLFASEDQPTSSSQHEQLPTTNQTDLFDSEEHRWKLIR